MTTNASYLLSIFLLLLSLHSFGQHNNSQLPTSINEAGTPPDDSAILDVQSVSQGILVPRMTSTQRNAILNPATGLLVFDTVTTSFWYFDGTVWVDLAAGGGGGAFVFEDADGDTKIQVEESSDEDIIRFDLAGTEHFAMLGPRLEVKNSGNSVFIGQGAGIIDDLTDNFNVGLGYAALYTNTTGDYNTASGSNAMYFNSSGTFNTATGRSSLFFNTTRQQWEPATALCWVVRACML